jgi:hypothetical protein
MTMENIMIINEIKTNVERVFKAPEAVKKPLGYKGVFLSGAIDMGEAEDWQSIITKKILNDKKYSKLIVVNPRRNDWDSSWKQEKSNKKFNEQVTWELKNLEKSDYIIVYFTEESKAPITLLELGLMIGRRPEKVIVYCPKNFYRKGNVDIVCDRYHIKQAESIDDILEFLED